MKLQAGITALAVGVGLFALACEQSPTTLDAPDIRAAVKLIHANEIVDVSFPIDNPCTPPEWIEMTGTDHQILFVWDTNGNGEPDVGDRFKSHIQFNLKGTDANGVKYRLTDAQNEQGLFESMPYNITWTSHVISSTDVDNFLVTSHLTINANGDLTVFRISEKCVG